MPVIEALGCIGSRTNGSSTLVKAGKLLSPMRGSDESEIGEGGVVPKTLHASCLGASVGGGKCLDCLPNAGIRIFNDCSNV